MSTPAPDAWLKRQAINVVAQLPDDPADAIAVLKHAERLVRTYLAPDLPPELTITRPRLIKPCAVLAPDEAEASLPALA